MKSSSVFNSLKDQREFQHVFNNGIKKSGNFYTAFFVASKKEVSRLGIIVSKKIGIAVVRNYYKRVIREHFRKAAPFFKASVEVVIILRKTPVCRKSQLKDLERIMKWLEISISDKARP